MREHRKPQSCTALKLALDSRRKEFALCAALDVRSLLSHHLFAPSIWKSWIRSYF